MGEPRVGEGGASDRRPATEPVEEPRVGQASIEWGRTGSRERADYDLWERRYVSRLLAEDRIDELKSAAATGTSLARARLADVYAAQGRIEELRSLAGPENEGLVLLLTDTLAGQDDLEVKVAVMKVRLQIREEEARDQLIELLRAQDRIEEAITFLRAHTHEYAEWHLLVHLLLAQGRVAEVLAMDDAEPRRSALSLVAAIFAEQGRVEELRALVTPGSSTHLATLLARTLAAQGRVDEGIAVLQERVDAGEEHSRDWLIDLLVEQGRADQAITLLEGMPYSYTSISTADVSVARLLDEQGRAEDAIRFLQSTASAPEQLAALVAARGRVDEAVRVLDRAIGNTNTRYPAAVERLTKAQADLLVEHGRIDELRTRAATGHPAYGVRLAEYDRTDETASPHDAGRSGQDAL